MTPQRRRTAGPAATRAVAVCVTVALAVAGCGGTGTSGPTRAQYVQRANGVCATAGARIDPLVKRVQTEAAALLTGGPGAAPHLAADLQQLHATASGYLAQLRALKQPSGDRAAIKRFLDPLSTFVDSVGKAATVVAGGSLPEALALLQQGATVEQQAVQSARAYGLSRCEALLPSLS